MTTWPAWFPGLPLKSQHLLGLEDYLLTRAKLEAPDTGLESFDWVSNLEFKSSESAEAAAAEAVEMIAALKPVYNEGFSRFRNREVTLPRRAHAIRKPVKNP